MRSHCKKPSLPPMVSHMVPSLVGFLLSLLIATSGFSPDPLSALTVGRSCHRHLHHHSDYSPRRRSFYRPFVSLNENGETPPGRVKDIDDWIRLSSQSLKKFTGKSIFQELGVEEGQYEKVHSNERFGVLSHGTQDDPIYHYFNKAALNTFLYDEDEIYQLPSRYSAPEGPVRETRQGDIQTAVQQDVRIIPDTLRQTKFGDIFRIRKIVLWNVYDDDGTRIGQTAIYDREQIISVDDTARSGS